MRDVASLIKTAEVMEMTSLKLSVSHSFGEDFSCSDTSIRSLNDRCSVSCTNLTKNDTKNLLEEQVSHDSSVLYMREERLNSKSQNIYLQSVGDSTKKYLNVFQDVPEKLNKDQEKGSIPNTCDSFEEITKEDEENVYDKLIPLTFVAVPRDSEINEPIYRHQDNSSCFDSVLKDPLGEYSGNLIVAKEINIKEECTFQSELQVKNEPKEENDVPESMTEVVLIADKLTCLCHELKSTESNSFVSCVQESAKESNPDFIISDTLCSEVCAAEEMCNMEIKFESICEISSADVKEEKVSETGRCLNHCVDDDTETPLLEPESELLKRGAQHFSTIDYLQDVNGEECDASTRKIISPFRLEIGNETPDIHRSAFTQIQLCEEIRGLMERTGNNSSHIASLNTKKECNNQHLAPRDSFHLDPSEERGEGGLTGKVQTHCTIRKNYSRIRCRKLFNRKDHLKGQLLVHTVGKPFQCEICKKSFNQNGVLKRHIRTHTEDKPYQCEICQKSFHEKCTLTRHKRTHTRIKLFECETCGKSFNEKGYLKKHIRTHTGNKPFKCEICEKLFFEKNNLTKHIRTHTGDKPIKCEICGKSFNQKGILKMHMRTHSEDKPYQCEICKKLFHEKITLTRHMRTHTRNKLFECEICRKTFNEKGYLSKHMRTHIGDKPYQCEICGKSFNEKGTLTRHIRTHTCDKPYQCEICKSSFRQGGHLKSHLRTHTGDKPYQCQICEKSFNVKGNLSVHISTHTGDKPFKCFFCEKSLSNKANLKNHMLTHTGEKRFQCQICQFSFSEKNTLKSHMRKHTRDTSFQCERSKTSSI